MSMFFLSFLQVFSTWNLVFAQKSSNQNSHDAYCFSILHVNDQHSHILPTTKRPDGNVEAMKVGGAAHVWGLVDERRKALRGDGKEVLVIHAGDEFQGSEFYVRYKGLASAQILNEVGLDFQACGNHEFDDGPKNLANYLNNITFPFRAHNIDVREEPALQSFTEEFYPNGYKIVELKVANDVSVKVAMIGITTTSTPNSSNPGEKVKFLDEITSLKALIPTLRKTKGVDHVIVVSHSGKEYDIEIAKEVPGIDAIVGGHSHTLIEKGMQIKNKHTQQPVVIVQAKAFSEYVGEVEMCWPKMGASLGSFKATNILVDNAKYNANAKVSALVDKFFSPLKAMLKIWGYSANDIIYSRAGCSGASFGCDAGHLVVDSFLNSHFNDPSNDRKPNFAFSNAGGIRASIKRGDLSYTNLRKVLPFDNGLFKCSLSGAQLHAGLENLLHETISYDADSDAMCYRTGGFPVPAGLKFTYDPVHRVLETTPKLADNEEYTIVLTAYLKLGKEGWHHLVDKCNNRASGTSDIEALTQFVKQSTPLKVSRFEEGRGVLVGARKPADLSRCPKRRLRGRKA